MRTVKRQEKNRVILVLPLAFLQYQLPIVIFYSAPEHYTAYFSQRNLICFYRSFVFEIMFWQV